MQEVQPYLLLSQVLFFDETISLSKILGVSLIVIGAVSLNIKGSSKERRAA